MQKFMMLCMCSLMLVFFAACGEAGKLESHLHDDDHGHSHAHHAAHGGTLLEVGAHQANLEVVCDRETGSMTVYIFGPHAERPVRLAIKSLPVVCQIAADEFTLELLAQAKALSEETVGDSATFMLIDERFKTTAPIQVRVPRISIFGQTFEDVAGVIK